MKGRTLLAHGEEEFQEQSLALSFSWEPSPSNRGPSLSLSHTMGATAAGGMDALLNPTTMETLDAAPSSGQRFEAKLAYGFPAHNNRFTLTPAVTLALSPITRNTSLLWSFGALCRASPGGTMATLPGGRAAGAHLRSITGGVLPEANLLQYLLILTLLKPRGPTLSHG